MALRCQWCAFRVFRVVERAQVLILSVAGCPLVRRVAPRGCCRCARQLRLLPPRVPGELPERAEHLVRRGAFRLRDLP